ncbi:RING finger protein 214 [Pristis pectinata]|uniref:RING finger protein 214 n=1 Tax=Pristis pectinata TaxID=685728 RepID=UPI00223CB3DA|nr:RING finger protein 214 [Pristis pectinata]XP_051895863.1 RING finger protein 214 [Pristis pectinata]
MESAEVLDSQEKPEKTPATLNLEPADQDCDASSTDVPAETAGSVTDPDCGASLAALALSDSDLPPADQQPPSADLEAAVLPAPGPLAQDFDDIYRSDPENEVEEELAIYTPDMLGAHGVPETVLGDQQPVPYYIDCGESLPPDFSNYPEHSWLPDATQGQFPKPFADESLGHSAMMAGYWQNAEGWNVGMVPADEEMMVSALYEEKPDRGSDTTSSDLKEPPPLKSLADSAVQTDCVTVDAEVSTDQDVERYMNEVTAEREVLKDKYQEVLDRQTQVENQLQVKVRRLQQQQEEEENIYQDNVKQIKEMKVKLEELKRKSEKEKKEFAQKEQELKNEVERLYENGKRLMKEQEEKGKQVAILISNHSDKKEKLNEDLAKLRLQHNKLSENILEETERALKAEVQSLESKREIAVMMLDQAANEAELQIFNLRSITGSSNLAREWQRRLNDIQVQTENIKNQYKDHIQMVKNGAKLNSLPPIQTPTLPPPPAEPDFLSQRNWHPSPTLPPFFPSSLPPLAAFPPVAFYTQPVPSAPGFPLGLGHPAEVEDHSTPVVASSATKLEKLLGKLELKFPNCSRPQLMHILQRIKTSRGSIAGLSVEELIQQVGERLSDPDQCLPSGPPGVSSSMSGHFPPAATLISPYMALPKSRSGALPSYQERPALVPGIPRLCLMCQKVVPVSEVHPMACSHIVHKECIKFWAQTNKNSSCPFCPTPR